MIFLVIRYIMASPAQPRNEALLWEEKVNAKIMLVGIWNTKQPFILSIFIT